MTNDKPDMWALNHAHSVKYTAINLDKIKKSQLSH